MAAVRLPGAYAIRRNDGFEAPDPRMAQVRPDTIERPVGARHAPSDLAGQMV
jgi:hypothetical protein